MVMGLIYDCGCIPSRPKETSCNSYGTRWRVYESKHYIILRCRDCGRLHHFQLLKTGVQVVQMGDKNELS